MQEAIVQALPASRRHEDASRQSPSKQKTSGPQSSPAPPSTRCTRSQAAPDWTVQEIMVLLNEIAAIDEEWLNELSSYQRWKMLSDSCVAMNVMRSSNQCKRKWEMLLDDYMKIRKWKARSREDSYWLLPEDRRKDFGLPASFQKEVFDAMNAVIQVQKHQSVSKNSDPDRIICIPDFETSYDDADSEEKLFTIPEVGELVMTSKRQEMEALVAASKSPEVKDLVAASKSPVMAMTELIKTTEGLEVEELATVPKHHDSDSEVREFATPSKSTLTCTLGISEKAHLMAGILRDNAEHVFAVLRGELHDGAAFDPSKPSAASSEVARRQADELIKALAGLTNSLDELCGLISGGGSDGGGGGIKPVNSMA